MHEYVGIRDWERIKAQRKKQLDKEDAAAAFARTRGDDTERKAQSRLRARTRTIPKFRPMTPGREFTLNYLRKRQRALQELLSILVTKQKVTGCITKEAPSSGSSRERRRGGDIDKNDGPGSFGLRPRLRR